MRQATALALKLAAYLGIFLLLRPIQSTAELPHNILLAAVHTLLLWLADLVILPRFGSLIATLGDIAVLLVGTLLVARAIGGVDVSPQMHLLSVALGAAFEWWFHRWLASTAIVE